MEQEPDWAEGDPEIAALLAFTPVPRRIVRPDGWDPARQRGFIAWLAAEGNAMVAATRVGRTLNGARQVRREDETGGFRAAWEAALALHRRRHGGAGPRPPAYHHARAPGQAGAFRGTHPRSAGVYTAPGEPLPDEAQVEAFLKDLLKRYLIKLKAERVARLEGRIVEADFYVRQLTCIELMLDIGGDTAAVLELFNARKLDPIGISATPGSTLLERARRAFWQEQGEADRPPPAPLGWHDETHATGRDRYDPARDGDYRSWERARDERRRLAAEAQKEWERRGTTEGPGDSSPPSPGGGEAGPSNDNTPADPEDSGGSPAA